jgi:hypothetical protein
MKFVEREEGCRRVAATAAESTLGGDGFLEVNSDAARDSGLGCERLGGAPGQVAGVGGDAGLVAGQFDAATSQLEVKSVKDGHRQHQHLQLVKAIVALSDYVEQQVDFAVRLAA